MKSDKYSGSNLNKDVHIVQGDQKKIFRINEMLHADDGNVESAMVLIPMLILFLVGVQLIVATNIRNVEMALAQGDASSRAISHQVNSGDELHELVGRVGTVQILISRRSRILPQLVPGLASLMGGNPTTDVRGIAVIEPTTN